MSVINLCQIVEMSKDYKNVYDFNSREEQLSFMQSKTILQLETNAKIDNFTSTITLNCGMNTNIRKCDYLFARGMDSKYLFFFIDNVEVVTTSTVKVYLTLDVWQTYHLSIQLKPSYVVRQHVPRWQPDGTPTREIVPEPVSVGNYVLSGLPQNKYKINQGCYIYYSSAPIGLITKDDSGQGGDTPKPDTPTGGCGNIELGIPSIDGFKFIKGEEGMNSYAVNIGDGVMTIGYGCTDKYDGANYTTLKANEPVSEELASEFFAMSLVSNYGVPLKNSLVADGITVTQNEFDAILSFYYNAGSGSWANSDIRACLLNGDKNGAYAAWLTQNIMSGTQFEEGLRARRQREANIFKNNTYEIKTITMYGQGGSVLGTVSPDESHIPPLISDECSQPSGLIEIEDENGIKGMFPCANGRFTNVYPNYNDGTYHGGIDLSRNDGVNIYPPRDNMKVVKVVGGYPNERNDSIGYGNYCVLEDNETKQRYWFGHMRTTPLVKEGDIVNQNTVLGNVGTSGYSTGPHLHYEIRVSPYGSGNRINPIKYIYSSDGSKHEPKINETFTRGEK